MNKLEYSAGAVSKGFWFTEFRKYNELLKEGKKEEEIRELQRAENIFLAPSEANGMKKVGEVARRTKALPEEILEILFTVNIENQKLINLLGIMMTDRLPVVLFYPGKYDGQTLILFSEFKDDNYYRALPLV